MAIELQLTGSTTDLRRHNRDAVLRLIRKRGAVSRTEIAGCVGLTNAAVSRITRELIEDGLVEEGERIALKGQAGRRQVTLRISEEGAYVVGIAVTLNAREVVIADAHGKISARDDCSDISLDDADLAIGEFSRRARALIARFGTYRKRLVGGAASVAGRVDPEGGRIMGAEPLNWDGQQVAARLTELIGLPFVAEGRAAALLKAEHDLGQATGLDDVLLINVGLKLGFAFMLDGKLLRGASNEAFMLGRYRVGRGQLLDDVASGFSILSRLKAAGRDIPRRADPGAYLRRLSEDPRRLDVTSRSAFRKGGQALGKAIAQLAPVLSPQAIVLAGLVTRQSSYIDGVEAALGDCSLRICQSRLTTAQSAIHLALEHHLFNQTPPVDRPVAA